MISLDVRRVIRNSFCYPKVDQFQLSFHKYEVCRFQVRVHDFLVVDDLYGLKHLNTGGSVNPADRQ